MIKNNKNQYHSQLEKEFINTCIDLATYINTQSKNILQNTAKIKLVLNTKIAITADLLEKCIEHTALTQQKIKTLNNALQILSPLPNKIPSNNPKLQLVWLNLISLITSIKEHIAIIATDSRNPSHQKIIGILLADLLMNIIDPTNLPTIPPPSDPEYRQTLTTLLNTLQDHMTTFDIIIEIIPFISKQEFLKWITIDIQYYQHFSQIVRKHVNKTLYQIYKKTKEEHLFATNYIILFLNLINLASLFKTIQQTLNQEWQKDPEITKIIPPKYPKNIEGITKFIITSLNYALNQLETWRKTGEILVTEQHYETTAFQELKTGYNYVKALNIKYNLFKQALKIEKTPTNTQKETLSLLFNELSTMWEVLMKTIIKNNPLTPNFFKNEQGADYLEFFEEFLETITLESTVMNTPSIYYEKIRPYQEIFIHTSPSTHPKLWLKKAILELYMLTNTNTKINIKNQLEHLQTITKHLKKIPKDHFSLLNLQLTIITTNKETFSKQLFQQTLQKAKNVLKEELIHPEYEKKATQLLKQIEKQYNNQPPNFQPFYSRLEKNPFDYTTWAIPKLPNDNNNNKYPLKYFPFNRVADKII